MYNPKVNSANSQFHQDISSPKYCSSLGSLLDQISFFMFYPWASLGATVIAIYTKPLVYPYSSIYRVVEKLILGPFLAILFSSFTPIGISGFILWVLVCTFFTHKKYSYLCLGEDYKGCDKQTFTLTTANILLGNELFCRLNNMSGPLARYKKIGKRLMQQSSKLFLRNLTYSSPTKEEVVITNFPDVDILCLQEVWERYWAATLIDQLRGKYSYFIHDVGDHRLCSNYCLFGSGLFVASKYPIVAAHFHGFQNRRKFARYFSFGVLSMKIRLDDRRVAYVANVHGQAYQGRQPILFHQMTETLSAINSFRSKTLNPEMERVAFDAICGDFNFDNMSPADEATQKHALFYQYADICSKKPGEDEPWTVGTELRQIRMLEAAVSTADGFRRVLIDDIRRRFYMLDADVLVHTKALASADAIPDKNGEVTAEPWGGKRRIDRILLRRDAPARIVGYAFSTALCGLTDHLPVVATLEVDDVTLH